MASQRRVNVETNLFTRGEWFNLVLKTGSPDTALGALVRVWIVAQRYWFPDRRPIPLEVWEREGLNQSVIDVGFAEKRDGGIYVRGSNEQFAWLFDASEKGKKSADARRKSGGTAQPKRKESRVIPKPLEPTPNTVQHSSNTVQHGSNTVDVSSTQPNSSQALTPTLTPTLTLSLAPDSKGDERENAPAPIEQSAVAEFYSAWRERYGGRAPLMPEDHKKLKRLSDAMGPNLAARMVRSYLGMDTSWFLTKRHDVQTLMSNLAAVQNYLDTGNVVTAQDAKSAEADHALKNQMARLARGAK